MQPEHTFSALRTTDPPGHIAVEPAAETVVAGGSVSVLMDKISDAGLSPQRLLVVAVNKPPVETVMLDPVSPVDQFTIQPGHISEAISSTDSPGQSVAAPAEDTIGETGNATVETSTSLETEPSPQVFRSMAVKIPSVETVILFPVSPLDQNTLQSGQLLSAVSSTEAPGQRIV